MENVLIVGATTVDFVAQVERFEEGQEEIPPKIVAERISGFGWNCAHNLKAFSISYDLVSPVGTGIYADKVIAQSQKENYPLAYTTDELNGCTYTMVDMEGHSNLMVVPGGEYIYSEDALGAMDPRGYSYLLCSGAEFEAEGSGEYYHLLRSFPGQVIYMPGARGVLLDSAWQNEIFALHPIMYVKDSELPLLVNQESEDVFQMAHFLQMKTGNALVVMLKDGRSLYLDDKEELLISGNRKERVDESGVAEAHLCGFVTGLLSGLNKSNALLLASACGEEVSKSFDTTIDLIESEHLKDLLVRLITEM